MAGGFLNRWSRRKAGEQVEPEKKPVDLVRQTEASEPNTPSQDQDLPASATLEDVEKIDRFAPDFSAFMKPGVDPTVQQAALKKMFSDPHFNVMDGLDIYIDDYSKPDPIPLEMLKRMVQSDMLNIFRKVDGSTEEDEKQLTATSPEDSEKPLLSSDQVDLTATHSSADLGGIPSDSIPSEQKNS
jgi:hypothetical protein